MENSQNIKIEEISDIRQSEEWAHCLEIYGWKSFHTSFGSNIEILSTKIGGFVKIQKPKPLGSKELAEIEKICKTNKALFIKIEPHLNQDLKLLKDAKYITSSSMLSPTLTILLDLKKSKEELWKDLSYSAKYSTNRATREGVYVTFVTNPDVQTLEQFHQVYKSTGAVKHFTTMSLNDVKKRVAVFGEQSFLVLCYDKDKQLVGGKLFLAYKGNVWYIFGGTSAEARKKSKAGYALMWESVLYFKNLGYSFLDLEGIYDPRFPKFLASWGGFSHFKERFGGIKVEFPVPRVKYLNPVLKIISKLYGNRISL